MGLLLTLAAFQAAGQAPQNDGVIAGKVMRPGGVEGISQAEILLAGPLSNSAFNAATQNPLMLAEIAESPSDAAARFIDNARGTVSPLLFRTTSAGDGSFTFRDLAPGQYVVRAQREGYLGDVSAATGIFLNAASASVTIAAGSAPPEVRLVMVRGSTISGRVRDINGQPAPSRMVTVYQIGYDDGREILVPVASRATDDRGEYRVFWVAPGDYYLASTIAISGTVPVPILQRAAQPRTFFPKAIDARSSTMLAVREGLDFTGADIELRPPSTFRVSGRIVSPSSTRPGSQVSTPPTLYLLPVDSTQLAEAAIPAFANSATTPGLFEIQGVQPGTYDLVASFRDDTGRSFPARVRIDVGSENLEGVTLSVIPGVEVRARVLLDGNFVAAPLRVAPPRTVTIQPVNTPGIEGPIVPPQPTVIVSSIIGVVPLVQLRSREIYSAPFDQYVGPSVTSDPSGVFVFPNVPQGLYSVVASGVPHGVFVADIQAGGISIYDNGLVVGDRAPGMIDVILKSGAVSIEGTVRDSSGKSVNAATVVLVPSPSRRRNPWFYRTIRVTASGEFTLNNVAPGEYKVFAWESVANGAYMNSGFLSKYEARGLSVNLMPGGNRSFDLTAIPSTESR